MNKIIVALLFLTISHPVLAGRARRLALPHIERANRAQPEHPNLATLEGRGDKYAVCIADLAEKVLYEANFSTLAVDSYVSWKWSPSRGTWYTIRASEKDGTSYDLQLRANFDRELQTCGLVFDYVFHWYGTSSGNCPESVFLKRTSGTTVFEMGAVPNASRDALYYYCRDCKR